jgi:proteasome lid subunit RPN8/RPN11
MTLCLTAEQLQVIQCHAERTYPEECCGLLLGTIQTDCKLVEEVNPTANAWDQKIDLLDGSDLDGSDLDKSEPVLTRASRYWIAPQDMLAGMRKARDRNLEVIGIYHSHPDHAAVPSECDRRLAWSQYVYLIVSVEAGRATSAHSWVLDQEQQFQPEELAIEGIKS